MYISKYDLETIKETTKYLKTLNGKQAKSLYSNLSDMIDMLDKKRLETNIVNWNRIKTKREKNKNYGRKLKENGKYI